MSYYLLFAATFFLSVEALAEQCWRASDLETPILVHRYRPIFSLLLMVCSLSWITIIVFSLIKLPFFHVIAIYFAGGISAFLVKKTALGYLLITSAFAPVIAAAELAYAAFYFWRL